MAKNVTRNFLVNTTPSSEIKKGNILKYVGSEKRLIGKNRLLLIHEDTIIHKFKEIQPLGERQIHGHCKCEVLPNDYCLFWVANEYLQPASQEEINRCFNQF